jgi:hypothetical protein
MEAKTYLTLASHIACCIDDDYVIYLSVSFTTGTMFPRLHL